MVETARNCLLWLQPRHGYGCPLSLDLVSAVRLVWGHRFLAGLRSHPFEAYHLLYCDSWSRQTLHGWGPAACGTRNVHAVVFCLHVVGVVVVGVVGVMMMRVMVGTVFLTVFVWDPRSTVRITYFEQCQLSGCTLNFCVLGIVYVCANLPILFV